MVEAVLAILCVIGAFLLAIAGLVIVGIMGIVGTYCQPSSYACAFLPPYDEEPPWGWRPEHSEVVFIAPGKCGITNDGYGIVMGKSSYRDAYYVGIPAKVGLDLFETTINRIHLRPIPERERWRYSWRFQ